MKNWLKRWCYWNTIEIFWHPYNRLSKPIWSMTFQPFLPLNYTLSSKTNDLGLTVQSGPQWQAALTALTLGHPNHRSATVLWPWCTTSICNFQQISRSTTSKGALWRIWSPLRASLRDSACESNGTKERRSGWYFWREGILVLGFLV